MKNGMKLFAAVAGAAAAVIGVTAYRKYRDSYEQLTDGECFDAEALEDENDFEPIPEVEDDFTYYVEDPDQIMFDE